MLRQLSKPIQTKLEKLLVNTGDMALKRRARRIIEEINPQDGDRILDIGCGNGYYLHLLSNLGLKLNLAGVDSDKRALQDAKKVLKDKKVKLVWGDIMKRLPFQSSSFDKIILSEVVEHLPEDIQGLKEVRRILRKNGVLVLTVPNLDYPFFWDPVNWILQRLANPIRSGFWAGIWNQHERLYTPEQIKRIVEKAGLKVVGLETLTFWCLPFNHYILNLAARFLYHGRFSRNISQSIEKFEVTRHKRSFFVALGFGIFGLIDSLNNCWQPVNIGVGILLVAERV